MRLLRTAGASPASALRVFADALEGGAALLVADELVLAPAALAPMADEFATTSLLVRPAADGADVRVRHHIVVSASTGFHETPAADHVSVGALTVSAADAEYAAAAVRAMAALLDSGIVQSETHEAVELAAVALVRSGISVRAVELVDVPWCRARGTRAPTEAERARAEGFPEARIRQLQANRADDGFYSTFVLRRLSKPLTRLAVRRGWSPNAITVASFVIGLAAAAGFATGSWPWILAGAVALQASIVIDCVDGEVARATRRFSALGAWLDASTDRVKELAAYAGLAIGAGVGSAWWIAVLLVVVQTTRHMTDYDFSRVQRLREAAVPRQALDARDDGSAGAVGGWTPHGAMEASARLNRRSAVKWAKRALHMPIGERWLVLSLVAVLAGPQWALGALLALVLVAFAYVTAGRVLRTLTWSGSSSPSGSLLLARQADAGPIASGVGRLAPGIARVWAMPAGWAVPGLLRLVELGAAAGIVLAWAPAAVPIAFGWLAVVAFHHYDVLYRALAGAAMPRWLTWIGLGWDGRTIVLAAAGVLAVLAPTLGVGAVWLAVWLVVVASVQWLARGVLGARGWEQVEA